MRVCHLYFSYNVYHTLRYLLLEGDGTEIVKIPPPIDLDNPTDGSYEYDISNVNTLKLTLKFQYSSGYCMAAIALS